LTYPTWDKIVDLVRTELRQFIPARALVLDVSSPSLRRPSLFRDNIDPVWAEKFNREFWKINPMTALLERELRGTATFAGSLRMACPDIEESDFWKSYMQPQGHIDSLIGAQVISGSPAAAPILTLLLVRKLGVDLFQVEETRILERVLPALGWAVYGVIRSEKDWAYTVARDAFGLTPKLAEVAALIAKGHSNQEIGTQLGISLGTTKHYVHQILEATGAGSRSDLCRLLLS
jgi:DNA-binding CsgD family transcriptional regulator